MNNPRFLLTNEFDDASLSATSEATALPVTNLQDELRTKVYRASATAATVYIDMGEAMECNVLAVVQHNLDYDGTFCVAGGSSSGASDTYCQSFDAWIPLFGAGEGGAGEHGAGGYLTKDEIGTYFPAGVLRIMYFGANYRARYWSIGLLNAANDDGYVEAGRAVLGYYNASGVGVSGPLVNTPQDPSRITYSRGGQAWRDARTKYRTASYQFQFIAEEDIYTTWFALVQRLGVGVSFVADMYPENGNYSRNLMNQFYGHIPQGGINPIQTQLPAFGFTAMEIRESR